jgi:hypothetical protein
MGFNTETGSGLAIWAKIINGKIVLKARNETAGYVARVNKIGDTTYEKFFESFEGKLTNVKSQEGDYGAQWFFEFDDNGKTVIITCGYDNRYARTLINRLLNTGIDLHQTLTVKPYSFITDDEKKMSGCNVIQNGKKLDPRFTYEELPKPLEVMIKKVTTYSYDEQMTFLEEHIQKELLPKLVSSSKAITNISDDPFDIESDIYSTLKN